MICCVGTSVSFGVVVTVGFRLVFRIPHIASTVVLCSPSVIVLWLYSIVGGFEDMLDRLTAELRD